jgi:phosphoglycolate phosphatase
LARTWLGIDDHAPSPMSGYKVIVFDYDGTLFDTRPAIFHCVQRAFAACGRPIPALEAVASTVKTGLALQDTFFALDETGRANRTVLNELVVTYRKLYLAEGTPLAKPFAGTSDALQQIHGSGAKCVIVSNKGIAAIRRSLDQSRLSSFVDFVFGDEPGLPKKPDPAIVMDHILPRYGQLQMEQILVVGDTETDILFAKRTGISCCWASYGYGETERCRKLAPEHIISSIADLPSLVHCR